MLCLCGCGLPVRAGNRFLLGHNVHPSIEDRFWGYVEKTETCWLWRGSRTPEGYGQFSLGGRHDRKRIQAHRWAYKQLKGPIPEHLFVCHRCDIPACVRPDHLFLGTQADNIRDMINKNRHGWVTHPERMAHVLRVRKNPIKGERVWTAKLTAEQVSEIRNRYSPRKITAKQLAAEYSVSYWNIYEILWGNTWKHLLP